MVILEICDRKAYRIRASQLSTLRNDKNVLQRAMSIVHRTISSILMGLD